ncbi:hypothetical protein [Hoeflea prorocentri]|uniref:Uncharacterized protein n=1 Tax=Hoeflea prorocentri TaxID=1922333 RepID=A0A9X3UFV9_9HYPH|nr:hypothetical protein [Hoeflea prorocentri]MCY6380048.1 hypothetical protein [Hoeflea prorocentri]MDA5397848.1 hypothetical protein [Hoeflea prorocentri]
MTGQNDGAEACHTKGRIGNIRKLDTAARHEAPFPQGCVNALIEPINRVPMSMIAHDSSSRKAERHTSR